MQVSVETLKGLERKLTISVPTEKVEEEVSLRLKDLARKVKLDGFRPGKAPFHIVRSRFEENVREDVAREMVQSTLKDAFKKEDLVPASFPTVEPEQIESGKDFIYSAVFEIFPLIEIVELANDEIEVIRAEITDSDVEAALEKIREQNKKWHEVDRPAAQHDQVTLDFKGFINDEPFEGGEMKNYSLIIGSGQMIPGFEDGLIGGEKDKPFEIKVTFPNDYGNEKLKGQEATFKITIKAITEGQLPALDNLPEQLNIKEGGLDALKKDIKENMKRDFERRLSAINREKIFDKFLEHNVFDLPNTLIDQEIEHLKHEMYHRIFGNEHSANEKIPDFPRELFEERAKRRVHLGLLLSEYVKKHELVTPDERVNTTIEKIASAYESPADIHSWYRGSKERMAEIEAMVMEEIVAEKISEQAKLVEKEMTYDEVMNPATEKKGE